MLVNYNPNPDHARVGDCTVRAICKALNQGWEHTYIGLCLEGFLAHDMPSANAVWGSYLRGKGFKRHIVDHECDSCYTLGEFCKEYPNGTYIVGLDGHVVCVIDGNIYDSWDSSQEVPIYYWHKEDDT